jgi:hypothetical protein
MYSFLLLLLLLLAACFTTCMSSNYPLQDSYSYLQPVSQYRYPLQPTLKQAYLEFVHNTTTDPSFVHFQLVFDSTTTTETFHDGGMYCKFSQ